MFYDGLIKLYEKVTGVAPAEVTPIAASGSGRRYYRLSGLKNLIGVIGTSERENIAFIREARFFQAMGVNVPEIVAVSIDNICYLQTDLGSTSFYDLLRQNGENEYIKSICRKTFEQLALMQFSTDGFDWSVCYPVKEMDPKSIMWDLNYFKYCFLKLQRLELDEPALEDDFEKLVARILSIRPAGFMYRDFQSRNIMVTDGKPWLIDFQGGRRGPVLYDAVSFLWQTRANFSEDFRHEILNEYIQNISNRSGVRPEDIHKDVDIIILFRMLQVLGAYGFRGLIEGKSPFIGQIPAALSTCREALLRTDNFPNILAVIEQLHEKEENRPRYENALLTVTVNSFSYKKGIPEDSSGNGGGFVFDCRAIHNPGRYEPYKQLTGDDLPVVEFLERESDITQFLNNCYSLVDNSVEKYIERGFSSLVVNFGCTGGQHRSVYSATHMANHLHIKYGIKVILNHREQNILKVLG